MIDLRRLAKEGAEVLWSLLFPERCAGCGVFQTQLCDACRQQLQPLGPAVCARCGHPRAVSAFPPGMSRGPGVVSWEGGVEPPFCARCAGLEPAFVRARSAFVYDGVARRLVTALKYEGRRNLGGLMAQLAAPAFRDLVKDVGEVVVSWAPAHGSTVRSRGYNQAEVLARHLAREAGGVPVTLLTRKVARTRHQKALGREQRRQNLQGAFAPLGGAARVASAYAAGRPDVPAGHGVEGVVMVDDVYTTGATAQEVAGVIGRSTGLPVYVFTFCRTVGAGDAGLS